MSDSIYSSQVRRSVGLSTSSWRTHDENMRAKKARAWYAKLNAEKAQVPVRNSNFDGEILKRRDKS